jgi:hypothetical protein
MIKRTYCFVFILFMVFGNIQSAIAELNIEVINRSQKEFEDIDLIITAVGFSAMYGSISLGKIGVDTTPKHFSYKYKYGIVPLTQFIPSSLEECNLNMKVFARPKSPIGTLEHEFENIVTDKEIIDAEEQVAETKEFKLSLHGIRPPHIKLILTKVTRDNPSGIEAEFD